MKARDRKRFRPRPQPWRYDLGKGCRVKLWNKDGSEAEFHFSVVGACSAEVIANPRKLQESVGRVAFEVIASPFGVSEYDLTESLKAFYKSQSG